MTGWTFQVNSVTESATLTWNPIGSLKKLAITDGFNANGTITYSYNTNLVSGTGYDDLNRLVGFSATGSGGTWSQTFSFDQYNNVTKTGSGLPSWNPTYSPTTNHYGCTGCTTDSNGNVTNDGTNAYTWNAFSKMASVNLSGTGCSTSGDCIIYDALGRAVEFDDGSTKTEIWYSPIGKHFLNGTTALYGYEAAPGGGTILGSSYMHKDWMGNARIVSTVSTPAVTTDRAFAPYGEVFNIFGGTSQDEAMFSGLTQDIFSGVYDTPNRQMTAVQSRFMSPDPAGAGWNAYAWPTNPNSFIDPSGLSPTSIFSPYPLNQRIFPCTFCNVFSDWTGFDSVQWNVYADMIGAYMAAIVAAGSGSVAADGGSSASQLCFCADDVTSGVLNGTGVMLASPDLNVGLDAIPGGIQIGGIVFQYNGLNSYTDANGILQYVIPGEPFDATVLVNEYQLQVVNDAGSPLQGDFTVTEYGMSAYGYSVSPQSAGLEVQTTWVTNGSGGFLDPVGGINMSGTFSALNVINYTVNGFFVPTTNIQSINYNNGSLSTSMYPANPSQ